MRTSIVQIVAALALAAAPSLVNSPTARISLLVPCFGAGLILALRWNGRADPVTASIRERLRVQGQTLASLTDRLRDVMRQTEQAVLDMNERFMNIAGRVREQRSKTPASYSRSNASSGEGARLRLEEHGSRERDRTGEQQEQEDETAALTRDIHGVIEALQFEDIVRQQIALVVAELQQLQKELGEMERHLAPSDRQGPRCT